MASILTTQEGYGESAEVSNIHSYYMVELMQRMPMHAHPVVVETFY